jgi:hypothetical protein
MKQRDIKKLPPEEALDAWFAEAVALAKKYGVTAGFVVGVVHSPNVDRLLSYAHFGSGETDEWHRPFDIALVYGAEQRVAERVYLCAHAAATSAKIKEGYEKLSERKVDNP